MEINSDNERSPSIEDENAKGWTGLYLIVVAVLGAQIAFFAWLTKTFE